MSETRSFEELKYRKKEGKLILPRKTTLSQEVRKSIFLLISTLLGLIVLLSIVFLLNTSQATQKGYIMQQQQLDKENFLTLQRQWVEKIIQAQAFKTIQAAIAGKKMAKPGNMTYIQDPNSTVNSKNKQLP